MDKVKVKVTDNPQGHRHVDHEVEPGEILEVWPRQAAFLEERGIAVPYKPKKKSKKSKSSRSEESTGADDEKVEDETSDQ